MSDKDLIQALKQIIEKELGRFNRLLPKDMLSTIEKKIAPQIENIIEQKWICKKIKIQKS